MKNWKRNILLVIFAGVVTPALMAGVNELSVRERGGDLPNCAHPPFPLAEKKERYTTYKNIAWKNGQTIRVYFQNGTFQEKAMVEHYAREWERYGNFRFDFRKERKTQKDHAIVIKFEKQRPGVAGSSSLGRGTTSTKYRSMSLHRGRQSSRVVLHEFGHSLGFTHEQNNPKIRSKWKREAAIQYFMKKYKSSRQRIEDWLFNSKHDRGKNWGELDPNSVMAYYFPGKLFKDGKSFGGGSWLTRQDIKGVQRLFPGRKGPSDITPTELFFDRGKKTVVLSAKGGIIKLYVNRKLVDSLDARDYRGRYSRRKTVDISSYVKRGRTRIEYEFRPAKREYSGYVSIYGKKRSTGKRQYIEGMGCSSKYQCEIRGSAMREAVYIAHMDDRNRGQANYYDDPKSEPVTDPVVDPVKKKYDEKLNSPLLIAAYEGRTGVVRSLLRRRANPDAKYQGWTSLLYAAYFGHASVVRVLLENGADANIKIQGWRAIDFARSKGRTDIVRLLTPKTERAFIRKRGRAPRP